MQIPLWDTTRYTLHGKKPSLLVLALLMTASGLIAACGGGGGDEETPPKKLTAEWTYDLSVVPNLSGFRFYRQTTDANDKPSYELILDTTSKKNFSLTLPLKLEIPVNEIPNLTTPITIVMTAYDSNGNESDYSNSCSVN